MLLLRIGAKTRKAVREEKVLNFKLRTRVIRFTDAKQLLKMIQRSLRNSAWKKNRKLDGLMICRGSLKML